MDEPAVVTETAVEPVITPSATPVVAPVAEPTNYFGADGALNEGWQSTLSEELREDKSLMSYKTVQDLAKSNVMTKKMVGQNVIKMPSDTYTQGEWDEFHKAGGRPETAADYNLAAPEGMSPEIVSQVFPEARMEQWKQRLFDSGMSQKAATALVNEYGKDMMVDFQASQQSKDAAKAAIVGNLTTEYGAAYAQKMHYGDMAIEDFTGGDEAMKEALAPLRENEMAIKMMVHFGAMLGEGKPPSFAAIPTPSDYQDQIDTLMADPLYMKGTQPQRMKIAEKILALKKLQKPEPV
jgi:hypothetical protein